VGAAALAAWMLRRRKPARRIAPVVVAGDCQQPPRTERRSGCDRLIAERRRGDVVPSSPVSARIEAAMDRRSGADRRSGRDRRAAAA
jgi:hypothetical protein